MKGEIYAFFRELEGKIKGSLLQLRSKKDACKGKMARDKRR